jgi:hypothetical protein
MSGPTNTERGDDVGPETRRLRRHTAELASSLASTEEQVAATLEQVAKHRPSADAERVRAEADKARKYAAVLRDRNATYNRHSDDAPTAGTSEGSGTPAEQ